MLKFNGSWHDEACEESLKSNLIRIMVFGDTKECSSGKLEVKIDKQKNIKKIHN